MSNNRILLQSYQNGSDIGESLQNTTLQEAIVAARLNPNCKGVTYNERTRRAYLHSNCKRIVTANNPKTPNSTKHEWHILCIFSDRANVVQAQANVVQVQVQAQ